MKSISTLRHFIALAAATTLVACGGGGETHAPSPTPPGPPSLSVFAGVGLTADGVGTAGRLVQPQGIAVTPAGVIYVADASTHTIRRIGTDGAVSTFAGAPFQAGFADGDGASARFASPSGLALDGAGNLIVADAGNRRVRRITPAGAVSTVAGDGQCCAADGTPGRLYGPVAVVVDPAGNIYVADLVLVRKISPGGALTTIAGGGPESAVEGRASDVSFASLGGIARDPSGTLFLSERTRNTILKLVPGSTAAEGIVSIYAGRNSIEGGRADGVGGAALFRDPKGLASDAVGNIFVADGSNAVRKIAPGGLVTTVSGDAGGTYADGAVQDARFFDPRFVAIAPDGSIYVTEGFLNATVRKISGGVVSTVAGSPSFTVAVDGTGTQARFVGLAQIAADASGNLYVVDGNRPRRITPAGVVTTWLPAVNNPGGIASDPQGNVYMSKGSFCGARFCTDLENQLLRLNPTGDPAVFAALPHAWGLAADGAGNVYAAMVDQPAIYRVDASGQISLLAGSPTERGSRDGPAMQALFTGPTSVAADLFGNVYVFDILTRALRRIDAAGNVTTVATLAPATVPFQDRRSNGIAVDGARNVYLADTAFNTVRKISPDGAVSTVITPSQFEALGATGTYYPNGVAIVGNDLFVTSGTALVVLRNRP